MEIKKKIKQYKKYFVIQEKKCSIHKKDLSPSIFNKNLCKILNNKQDRYMILMSREIKSTELYTILIQFKTMFKIIKVIYTLSKRIQLLENADIIHMDMHFANILVSKKTNKLYVIDFGLGLNTSYMITNKLPNYDYLKENIFNPKLDWEYWTIEYNLLGYIVRHNMKLTKDNIMTCITDYYKNNEKIRYVFPNKSKYSKKAFHYFKRCIKKSRNDNVLFLLEMCKSWDYYKLAIHLTSFYMHNSLKPMSLLVDMLSPDKSRLYGKEYVSGLKQYIENNKDTIKKNKMDLSIQFSDTQTLSLKNI
jgi:hypothetical protein